MSLDQYLGMPVPSPDADRTTRLHIELAHVRGVARSAGKLTGSALLELDREVIQSLMGEHPNETAIAEDEPSLSQ
ncbi:MAG: hypothetical protein JWS12_753 [Candidatus Saccharibacteria bacterium]|nr:hypothetical protein [Candidatus Saccharibacteria bacterium]